jgi:hypothetical protein
MADRLERSLAVAKDFLRGRSRETNTELEDEEEKDCQENHYGAGLGFDDLIGKRNYILGLSAMVSVLFYIRSVVC